MDTPCLCTELRAAARRLTARYDAALQPLGIGLAQYFLLQSVAAHQPVALTELGRLAELDRSTVGRNLRVLKRMGLVESRRSAADRREAAAALTPRGEALLQQARPLWQACQRAVEARLGEAELQGLRRAMAML